MNSKRKGSTKTVVIILSSLAFVFLIVVCSGGYLLFSIARQEAREKSTINQLKQIGMAFHNYHDIYLKFPNATILDNEGNPRSSWRVAILPLLDHRVAQYQHRIDDYDFSAAWDSQKNLAMTKSKFPKIYESPFNYKNSNKNFQTAYQLVTGPGTAFEDGKKMKFANITDGTANTGLLILNFQRPVFWAEPKDITLDELVSTNIFEERVTKKVHILMFDGSVQSYKPEELTPEKLKNLFLISNGN